MNPRRHKTLLELQCELPAGELRFDSDTLQSHSGDKWFASRLPDAVALPRSTRSVATILRFAHRHNLPVTARGAGYGYVGGCVPSRGGVVLSLARMNRIKEINSHDFVTVVQPGVVTHHLHEAVEKQGLYYPPDPASRADSSIGGNIATNVASGSVVRLGSRTHKNKTGFDLARLFVGSEGLLGVVTEATLKLLPLPPFRACLGVGFGSMKGAARAIRAVFGSGTLPSALEVADAFTLAAAQKRTGSKLLTGCRAHIIVELDGQEGSVRSELKRLEEMIRAMKPVFVQRGYGAEDCEKFWQLRREFSYALRDTGLTKLNEDITVPRGRLEDLFCFAEWLQKKHHLPVACFGHAGDGNIHVNVMVDKMQPGAPRRSEAALDDLFRQVLAWGGVITGEHGIGLAKKRWWPDAASEEVRALHRVIKQALDPKGILNPGKFV
ncbi:MAG: FAD/FMN-containing dehydrogenase [Verrucomicrobia bacterium]|nr:MAG: FAD/FMN-containing dehydrogenase [Verrucomicrobiota bacterium]